MNTSTRIAEIEDAMVQEMIQKDIVPTLDNQYWFLLGLKDSWLEERDESLEKLMYLIALDVRIAQIVNTLVGLEE
jgi:hypothetical protein